jgi:hypothetical protein
MSLFRVESLILLVDSLYAEAIEAVKSRAALSAYSPELISILGEEDRRQSGPSYRSGSSGVNLI